MDLDDELSLLYSQHFESSSAVHDALDNLSSSNARQYISDSLYSQAEKVTADLKRDTSLLASLKPLDSFCSWTDFDNSLKVQGFLVTSTSPWNLLGYTFDTGVGSPPPSAEAIAMRCRLALDILDSHAVERRRVAGDRLNRRSDLSGRGSEFVFRHYGWKFVIVVN